MTVIFKCFNCPYCGTNYEMTTAHLPFKQRSYAKYQICHQTMYSHYAPGDIRMPAASSRPISNCNDVQTASDL
jgi:hypothetical protein